MPASLTGSRALCGSRRGVSHVGQDLLAKHIEFPYRERGQRDRTQNSHMEREQGHRTQNSCTERENPSN